MTNKEIQKILGGVGYKDCNVLTKTKKVLTKQISVKFEDKYGLEHLFSLDNKQNILSIDGIFNFNLD